MKVARSPIRVRVLAAWENKILGSFLRSGELVLEAVKVSISNIIPDPDEEVIKGALRKSLYEQPELAPLVAEAQKYDGPTFAALAAGTRTPKEKASEAAAQKAEERKIVAWTKVYGAEGTSRTSAAAAVLADRSPEVRRLRTIATQLAKTSAGVQEDADVQRRGLRDAIQAAGGNVLPEDEEGWLAFWDTARSLTKATSGGM